MGGVFAKPLQGKQYMILLTDKYSARWDNQLPSGTCYVERNNQFIKAALNFWEYCISCQQGSVGGGKGGRG